MRGGRAEFDNQASAVLREYQTAIDEGRTRYAENIREANPDLTKGFDQIDQTRQDHVNV